MQGIRLRFLRVEELKGISSQTLNKVGGWSIAVVRLGWFGDEQIVWLKAFCVV